MSDRTSAAAATTNGAVEAIVEAYVATWNETDAARRQAGSRGRGLTRGAIAIR